MYHINSTKARKKVLTGCFHIIKIIMKKYGLKMSVICFWLLLWELASKLVHQEIFLASPVAVAGALWKLCGSIGFWKAILFSSLRIIAGFLSALIIGTVLAVASYNSRLIKELISPLVKIIQAMPVASFIILVLVWISPKNLSALVSFLMVMPIIYINIFEGLNSADEKLLEMAKVFKINGPKKVIAIYIPAVMPYFIAAISVGVGLCWKAGIAAEVIGIPTGSIGERLYEAKLYLMTKELFAWTVVIIIVSIIFEKAVLLLVRQLKGGPDGYPVKKPNEKLRR